MTDRVEETFTLQAPRDRVLEILRDFESYNEWQPDMRAEEVLGHDDEGNATKVRWKFKGAMFSAEYTLAYEHRNDGMDFHLVEGDIIKGLEGSWNLVEDGGTTEATYALDAEPAIKIPKMLRRQGSKRMMENTITGLRQMTEND
jgi:ribosome-associated toxin RatA of RatAB toxin-antitoxin module